MGSSKSNTKRTVRGFTVVELMVVIIVMAILATVVVVSYRTVTNDARETSLKSDLKNSSATLTRYIARNETLPTTGDSLKKSKDTTYVYRKDSNSAFCLEARDANLANKVLHVTQEDVIRDGTCPPPVTVPLAVGPSEYSGLYDYYIELITGAYIDWTAPADGGSPVLEYKIVVPCGPATRQYILPVIESGTTVNPSLESPFTYTRGGSRFEIMAQHGFRGEECGASLCSSLSKVTISARNIVGWGPQRDFLPIPESC